MTSVDEVCKSDMLGTAAKDRKILKHGTSRTEFVGSEKRYVELRSIKVDAALFVRGDGGTAKGGWR